MLLFIVQYLDDFSICSAFIFVITVFWYLSLSLQKLQKILATHATYFGRRWKRCSLSQATRQRRSDRNWGQRKFSTIYLSSDRTWATEHLWTFFSCIHFFFILFWSRTARSSMKPDPAEDSVFLPERSVKVGDEVAEGEYGLVINGHSLVCHKKFPNYNSYCDCPCWLVLLIT